MYHVKMNLNWHVSQHTTRIPDPRPDSHDQLLGEQSFHYSVARYNPLLLLPERASSPQAKESINSVTTTYYHQWSSYKYLGELIIRYIGQLLAMKLGNNQLHSNQKLHFRQAQTAASTYGMSSAQRVDIKKGENLVALEELERGDIAQTFALLYYRAPLAR